MRLMTVLFLAFVLFVGFRCMQLMASMKDHPRATQPGQAQFDAANSSLDVNQGTVAFGNDARAQQLAAAYSAALLEITQTRFSGGKPSALSTSKGQVLVHCQLSGDTCVLIAHVPELRQYHSDVRDALAALAWTAAQKLAAEKLGAKPQRLAVGLRGVALYGPIQIGGGAGAPTQSLSGTSGLAALYPFFVPAASAAVPVPTGAVSATPSVVR